MVCSTGSCSAAPYPCYAVQSWSISWRVRCKPPSSTTKMRKPPCSSFSRCDFCIICLFGWDFCIICSLRFSRCGFCVICSFRLLRWDFHVLCLLRFSRWDILCVNFELKEMWLLFLLLFIQNKLQGCFQTLGWKQVLFLFPQNMQIWFEKIWFFFFNNPFHQVLVENVFCFRFLRSCNFEKKLKKISTSFPPSLGCEHVSSPQDMLQVVTSFPPSLG